MMLLRNLFWFVCLVIGLVVAPAHADNVHPGLWKAQGRAGTIYLFGTVHVLPQGLQWHTPALEQAEQASSNLYLEVGNLDDQAAMLKAFNAVGYGTNLPDIVDRVRPAKRAALAALLAKYHVNAAGLKPFKTWAVVISLSGLVLKDGQYDAENGVEHGLANDFNVAHKPVNGLETISEQLSYLDSVSLGGQEKFFESFIDDA
ncbi:MAG: TraB/GumN family protein, partial [Alphaproteobacteria bacterium]|nr:TraB/GumN family protein [Alphaproteobacteria bacterium]